MSALLTPEAQEKFWSSLSPDNSNLLKRFEQRENWTFEYDDLPDLYRKIEQLIPELQKRENTEKATDETIQKLINIIADLPLRQALSVLHWIDKDIKAEQELRWSSLIYIRSYDIVPEGKENENDEGARARLIKERIELMTRLNLLNDIFSK